MKKFTKLFLSCAAVAALTASVAVSAMAADEITVGEYDADNNQVSVKANYTADQYTLLILKPGVDITNITDPQASIVQIDQDAKYSAATDVATGDLADGTYTVWMGGATDGGPYSATFRVGEAEGVEILIGNVNQDQNNRINSADATMVLKHAVVANLEGDHADKLKGAAFIAAAYCNAIDDTRANSADATQILKYAVADDTQKTTDFENVGVGKTVTRTLD